MKLFFQNPFILALFSGILLSLSWPEIGNQSYLIFISFVPVLWILDQVKNKKISEGRAFLLYYIAFLLWNACTTWWVSYASFGGALTAIILNAFFMSLVFYLFARFTSKFNSDGRYFILIPLWLSWEKLHLHWELSWPWLTLGNVFSKDLAFIQWYEFTGHLGGTLWILLINILVFICIQKASIRHAFGYSLLFLFIAPCLLSLFMWNNYTSKTEKQMEVVIIQPNIDPYYEKFSSMSSMDQLRKILRLADSKITPATSHVFAPETAIPRNMEELNLNEYQEKQVIDSFLQAHPSIHFVTGLNTITVYESEATKTKTARKFGDPAQPVWIDFYNTGGQFHSKQSVQLYHKSKLVPGVEIMPYASLLSFLNDYAIDLGGTSGSLGIQAERSTFTSKEHPANIAPIICYESVYGEYVTEYVKKGANILAILTNDGWWENTPGYKQHLSYGSLRAIETRKYIVRSANTGISCVINEKGEIIHPTKWWKEDVLRETVGINSFQTFYVRFGDYVFYLSLIFIFFPFIKKP